MARILVVDDEFGIGDVLREFLADEGHDVALAFNGRQGLEMAAQQRPDLIFLDFMMPVLNGAGMLKEMAADPDLARVPVVIMSSLPEATVAERTRGYVGFVRKPFQLTAILDQAGKALGSRD